MKHVKIAIKLSLVMMLLCGLLYPMVVTGIGQVAFNHKANGSMVKVDGKEVGSELIGQKFEDSRFFQGRPSAVNYNTHEKGKEGQPASGSENLSTANKELADRVSKDMDDFLKKNPSLKKEDVPTDLLTASGSGLDPHISVESAKVQVDRISKATGISTTELNGIISRNTEGRQFKIFGEKRVNVLKSNLEVAKVLKEQSKL